MGRSTTALNPGRNATGVIYGETYRFDANGRPRGSLGLSDGPLGQQAVASVYGSHFGSYGGLPSEFTAERHARDWALPQFYFHVVTAYAIPRGRLLPVRGYAQSHQRQPTFNTCRIPEITRRSSTRRAPGWFLGRCGSIADHASSDNQNSAIAHLL